VSHHCVATLDAGRRWQLGVLFIERAFLWCNGQWQHRSIRDAGGPVQCLCLLLDDQGFLQKGCAVLTHISIVGEHAVVGVQNKKAGAVATHHDGTSAQTGNVAQSKRAREWLIHALLRASLVTHSAILGITNHIGQATPIAIACASLCATTSTLE
jgi:hypothetical protein